MSDRPAGSSEPGSTEAPAAEPPPAGPPPAGPPPRGGPLTGRLQALREGLAGKLGTAVPGGTGPLPIPLTPEALKQQAQARLDQARAELGGSALGLVAAGVLRGAAGEVPAIVGTVDPADVDLALLDQAGEAFSRQAAADAHAEKRRAEEAESRKRMAFIVTYVKDPTSRDFFADPTIVYQVFAEERTYQVQLLGRHKQELAALGPSAREMGMSEAEIAADARIQEREAERARLTKQIAHTTAVRTQLVNIMAKITGVAVDEAALDWEPAPAPIVVTEETSSADAMDAAAQLLARMKKK